MEPKGVDDASKSVYVTNISPSATEKKLADFFTFCGKINRISFMSPKQDSKDDSQSAVIVFSTEEAAQTALLLTNAHIVDRAIRVSLLTPQQMQPNAQNEQTTKVIEASQIDQKQYSAPDNERTKTSVIASLLAAGYVLGEDVLKKAKEYDEQHMISLHVKVGAQIIKSKAQEIDQHYKISEKANLVKDKTVQTLQSIDENLKISDKAASAVSSIASLASNYAQMAMQNENIARGIETIKEVGSNVAGTIKDRVVQEKEDIKRAIETKQKERGTLPNTQQLVPNQQQITNQPQQPQQQIEQNQQQQVNNTSPNSNSSQNQVESSSSNNNQGDGSTPGDNSFSYPKLEEVPK